MIIYDTVWNSLSVFDRKLLVFAAYPGMLEGIAQYEARRSWDSLLTATKVEVSRLNWNEILGRDVIECNQTHG